MTLSSSVIAYHGCDITTRDDLVSGRVKHLRHSTNKYDWLGAGAYFFEGDEERARNFAKASHENPGKFYTAKPIATPAVVGAILRVHNWLDMTTQAGIREFALAYPAMLKGLKTVPENRAASKDDKDIIYRALDSAVINFIHSTRKDDSSLPDFEGVRGAFYQGDEVAPMSGFHANTHVQIALREDKCVLGWFLPAGDKLLAEAELAEARARLDAAILASKKPRVKPG